MGRSASVAGSWIVAVGLAFAAGTSSREVHAREARTPLKVEHCRAAAKADASAESLRASAVCSQRTGDWAGAMNALTRWLEHPGTPEARKQVVRETTVVELAPKTARLVFSPPDAVVTIDGKEARTSSGVLYVTPGTHAVHARTVTAQSDWSLEMAANTTKLVIVAPAAQKPATEKTASGTSATSATSKSNVDESRAASPPVHAVAMRPLLATSVSAVEGEQKSNAPLILAIALASASVVAAGAGAWISVSAHGHDVSVDQQRREANQSGATCYGRNNAKCAQIDDVATTADHERLVAAGLFAGAGALAASAALTYFLWPGTEPVVRIGASAMQGGAFAGGTVRF